MCKKTSSDTVADAAAGAIGERSHRAARPGRRNSCLLGCACVLAIFLMASIGAGVWVWQYNRNPDPFPWSPEREWTLSATPVFFDFVDSDGSLVVLCQDRPSMDPASIVRCDFEAGAILSSCQLSFPASEIAVPPNADSVLIAGIIPSPDQLTVEFGRRNGRKGRPHVLRMVIMRLSDWAIEAETEEEVEATSYSCGLAASLRVESLPARQAWVVGIYDSKEHGYRVSLYDQKTLAELDSRTVPSGLHSSDTCLAIDSDKPTTVLVGRPYSNSYRWDSWATDSGEVTSTEARRDTWLLDLDGGQLLPGDAGLSDVCISSHGTRVYRLGAPHTMFAISPDCVFYAHAYNSELRTVMPTPMFTDNCYQSELGIWSLMPMNQIVGGIFQGQADAITALRFSPDNKFLITGHLGGDLRIWKLPASGQKNRTSD